MNNESFFHAFNARHNDDVTVTLNNGTSFRGFIENDQTVLSDTPIKFLWLVLGMKFGRGDQHRIKASEIVAVTRHR